MKKKIALLKGILLLCICLPTFTFSQIVIYVDSSATGLNNGQSWQNAYTNLDSALIHGTNFTYIDSIKIAKGTYMPSLIPGGTSATNPRDAAFYIAFNGVFAGGYSAGGTVFNPKLYPTILSGDLGIKADFSDNAYHVLIVADSSLEIVGLSITGGRADGTDSLQIANKKIPRFSGGGMYFSRAYINVHEMIAEGNYAITGGAVYNHASKVDITNTLFYNNNAYRGGALYNSRLSTISLKNIVAYKNFAEDAGGAVVNDNATKYTINHSTFVENFANGFSGGAIYNTRNSVTSKISNSIFSRNYLIDSSFTYFLGSDITDSSNTSNVRYCVLQAYTSGQYSFALSDAELADVYNPAGPDGIWRTQDDGLKITVQSQAFKNGGEGSNAFDITGAVRNLYASFDIGAYEINPCSQLTGRTIYVDSSATGTRSGSSWANALTSLQGAINLTQIGCADTIKVAKGTYAPTNYLRGATGDVTLGGISFQLTSNLALLGGYAQGGSATADPAVNKTILSGTSGRVLFAGDVSNIILDGLHIQNGTAYGSSTDVFTINSKNYPVAYGGGLMVYHAGVTVRRCVIRNNQSSEKGGGIMLYNSKVKIDDCTFERNSTSWSGGGVCVDLNDTGSVISNTVFKGNTVNYFGGGLYVSHGYNSITITNSEFSANKTLYSGGNAIGGGALFSDEGTHVNISKCVFDSNSGDFGGALRIDHGATNKISNSFFLNNQALRNGGAICNSGGTQVDVFNCVFSENAASGKGGGIFAGWTMNVYFSTFVRNRAGTIGGGCDGNGLAILSNSIFWLNSIAGNTTAATSDVNNATMDNSALQVFPVSNSAGRNISGVDPLFVNSSNIAGMDAVLGTADDGLTLQLQSPLLNEGQAAYDSVSFTKDITGAARRLSIYPDMGAYETDFCALSGFTNRTIYVDSSAVAGNHSGQNWVNAFTDLESALRAFRAGCNADTIKIAKGTYVPSAVPRFSPYHVNNRWDNTFALPNNIVIMGGYPTGGGVRNFRNNLSILSGTSQSPPFLAVHVVFVNNKSNVTIDGVCIQDGSANGGGNYIDEEDTGPNFGGGLYVNNSTLYVKNSIIRNNSQAVYVKNSHGRFINCVMANNTSPDFAAGVMSASSPIEYINCIFSKNTNYGFGGAVYIAAPDGLPSFKNCTFYGNSASLGGAIGAGYVPFISNCLFWNNRATSVLVPQRLSENELLISSLADSSKISFSLFQYKPYNYTGINCIYGLHPAFADSTNNVGADMIWGTLDDGLRQTSTSYAINHGFNDSLPPAITTDITGAPRINGGVVDMGAYECDCSLGGITSRLVLPGSAELASSAFNSCGTWQLRSSIIEPSTYIIEIDPNGNTSFNPLAIKVDVTSTQSHTSTNGVGNTTDLAFRMVSINAPGAYTVNGGLKMRVYYDPAEFAGLSGNIRYWFKHPAHDKATVLLDLHADTLTNAVMIKPASYGIVNGVHYVEFHNLTGFSTFGYMSTSHLRALPVQFLSFTAKWAEINKSVLLNWETAGELNVKSFIVERSDNRIDWHPLVNILPAGTSVTTHFYNWTDMRPVTGQSYYRIKQVDNDSRSTFSEMRLVNHTNESREFAILPNPVTNTALIRLASITPVVNYKVTDLIGRVISQGILYNANEFSISLIDYPAGTYFLTINQTTQKLIVFN